MEVMAAFFPIGIKCCIAIGNQIIKLSCTIRPNGMRADDVYDTAVILKGRLKMLSDGLSVGKPQG